MRTSIVLAAFLVAVLLLLAPSHAVADGITLSIQPVSSTVSVGSTFALDVNISGVTDLYAFQFDLSFDPSILEATGTIAEGNFFQSGGGFVPGVINNSLGTITFNANSLLGPGPGLTGSGTLMVFDFTALAPGTSALTILNNADLILQDSTGAIINATTTNGSVTVQGTTSVPEPSSLMMLGAGLLGLASLTLKKTVL